MWYPDTFLESLYAKYTKKRTAIEETKEQKKTRLQQKLVECLGRFDPPANGLQPKVIERVEDEDIIRERVEYSTGDGLRVPAYVLIPKSIGEGERRPAVIAWHGHGYGSRSVIGLTKDGHTDERALGSNKHYGWQLAKQGLVVIAPDLAGLGDRLLESDLKRDPNIGNSCLNFSMTLLMYGKSMAGLRTHEALLAMDYLLTRPEVDPERVGCIGFSGGGTVASLAAALDERIKATVVCGYSNTYKGSIMWRRHCVDNYIPGILEHAEMPDLLGMIAPRGLFIESGKKDKIFPVEHVETAVSEVSHTYKQWGAEDQFAHHIFDGGHDVNLKQSLPWLIEQLKM